jgi:hypothetical protein
MRRVGLVTLVVILAASQTSFRSQQPFAKLHAERREGVVRLAWTLTAWPSDLRGFVVRWRPVGQGGAPAGSWTSVRERPITPGMWADKDLSAVEPDPARRKELESAFQSLAREKRIREVREQEFLSTVSENAQVLQAVGREILADFRRALFIGMGCVDRGVPPGRDREYGLFAVRASGRPDDQPAATAITTTFSADDERLKVADLATRAREAGNDLSWRFAEASAQRWSVYAFAVLRADAASSNFEPISPAGAVASARVESGWRYFTFVDSSAIRERRYVYAIAPVNVFGTMLETRTVVEHPRRSSALPAPAVQQLEQESGVVDVAWTFDASQQAALKGFLVERLQLPDGRFEAVSPLLPPGERRFSDSGPKTSQTAYVYRVRAQGAGEDRVSAPMTMVFVDQAIPPKPASLSAEYVKVGARSYVRLQWPAKPPADTVTEGYALFADKTRAGVMSRQASVPIVRGSEYLLEVPTLESRRYTVAVAGVAPGGVVGPPVEATVFVPGKLPAAPASVTVTPDASSGALDVRWQYSSEAALRGFRVSVDRAVAADERRLGADARSWRFETATPGRTYRFEVVAVTREGTLSMPADVAFTAPVRRPGAPQ